MKKDLVLVTYNRPENFKRVWDSIDKKQFRKIVVVHDGGGKSYPEDLVKDIESSSKYYPFTENKGVGVCKKQGVDTLLKDSDASDYIFIVEDDVVVKDNSVWDYYINFSKASGVWHTNWNDYRYKQYKFSVNFDESNKGVVTRDVEGSFSFFHKNMFKFCEFPSDMKNAFEHISVELQLIEKDLLPPFWNFICPSDSDKYLECIGAESTITGRKDYKENWGKANEAFTRRHGLFLNTIPQSSQDVVLSRLKFLKENYAK